MTDQIARIATDVSLVGLLLVVLVMFRTQVVEYLRARTGEAEAAKEFYVSATEAAPRLREHMEHMEKASEEAIALLRGSSGPGIDTEARH